MWTTRPNPARSRRLRERRGDVVVEALGLAAEREDRDDDDAGDGGEDERIFDRRRGPLVREESPEMLHPLTYRRPPDCDEAENIAIRWSDAGRRCGAVSGGHARRRT